MGEAWIVCRENVRLCALIFLLCTAVLPDIVLVFIVVQDL